MGIKGSIETYGIVLLAIVALAKPIATVFGQAGGAIGNAFSMGLQNFASQLTGGLIPSPNGSMMGSMTMQQQQMMMGMIPNPMGMGGGSGENLSQAIVGGIGTVGGGMAIKSGLLDNVITVKNGQYYDNGYPTLDTINGSGVPSAKTGAVDLTPELTAMTLSDLVTGGLGMLGKLTGLDTSTLTENVPSITSELTNFFRLGGTKISDFYNSFKFPSGMTLEEILTGSGEIIPEANALVQNNPMTPSDSSALYYNKIIQDYENNITRLGGGGIVNNVLPMLSVQEAMKLIPIYEATVTRLISQQQKKMAMGLVPIESTMPMVTKVNIPGQYLTGTVTPGSIGAGKPGIAPPDTLTEVLKQNPSFSASQAADYLFRLMGSPAPGFDFGTNTGSGIIPTFSQPTPQELMMGVKPVVTSIENNPVLLAYNAYKAQYGG